jgi:predicted nuclease of predicted toxin-antitoxin system
LIVQFLIDASLPRDVAKLFLACGHGAIDVRDIGLRHADDPKIAAHAKSLRLTLISCDFDFGDIRIYPPSDYFGLVIIDRPDNATVAQILELVERFLAHHDLLNNLVGRLVVVDKRRIRIRPPLPES